MDTFDDDDDEQQQQQPLSLLVIYLWFYDIYTPYFLIFRLNVISPKPVRAGFYDFLEIYITVIFSEFL